MQSWLNRDFDRENKKPQHPNTILEAFQVMNIVTGCNHLIGEGKSIPESFGSSPYVGFHTMIFTESKYCFIALLTLPR